MNRQDVYSLFDVTGKVALITGATGGFGGMAAKALAAAGAKVMVTARTVPKLEDLVAEIRKEGGEAAWSAGSPISPEEVSRVVRDTVDAYGSLDILITAAGINKVKPIIEQPLSDWEEVLDVNLKGSYLFCKEAGRVMVEQGKGGKVILVSSARGMLGLSGYTAYSPSKAAINLLTKSLACEWGPQRINVNAIAPTVFRTALTQWMFDDNAFYLNFLKRIPLGRLGEPEDFIGTIILLSSKASDFMTGAVLYVDGGYTAG
jgi:NAD(P)-dependent dehydrogenase (short-subunit alcohol dehydrogenase family)